jgi:hypothetical protein
MLDDEKTPMLLDDLAVLDLAQRRGGYGVADGRRDLGRGA